MMLLPPKAGVCPICAVDHPPDQPHNQQSLYYQYRFYGVRGRWPTWADAMAHCAEEIRLHWERTLRDMMAWSEPENGDPIADPPQESVRQAVGDLGTPSFGPEPEVVERPTVKFRRFVKSRAHRGVEAAQFSIGHRWLWMSQADIENNIRDFGDDPEFQKGLEAYRTPCVSRDENLKPVERPQ
jgi:hypothetical protein